MEFHFPFIIEPSRVIFSYPATGIIYFAYAKIEIDLRRYDIRSRSNEQSYVVTFDRAV